VNVCPAIVSVPDRGVDDVLAVALKLTVPLPLPLAPPVTLNHDVALLVAAQLQPVAAVTLVDPVLADAAIDCDVGENDGEHDTPA
jgi:hypothetical protein